MKKIALYCVFALFMCCMVSAAFGVEYGADFLERDNPGGWSESLKTFDEGWTVSPGRTVNVDIWIKDLPEELITAGFQMEYDASLVSVSGCDVYDGSLPGPWDVDMTTIVANPSGTSTYVVIVGNLGCVQPDAGGDIPIARIKFEGTSPGETAVTFRPVAGFDTVVGDSATVYDSQITAKTMAISIPEGGQCVSEAIYGEYAEETELLRYFRDSVLSETREGQELIEIYYYWNPAVVGIMADDKIKAGVKTMLDAMLPFIRHEMNKQPLLRKGH